MTATRILIVEDEALIAEEIQDRLHNLGYEITGSIHRGETALKSVEKNPPDLVLMDIVLRGKMDGIQAADKIATRFNIPVVFLTAYADKETIWRAKMTHANGYLIKPIREKELRATIELALEKHKLETRLMEREACFHQIFDHASFGMCLIDPEQNKFLEVNLKASEILGYTQEELLSKPVSDLHPDEQAALNAFVESVIKNGQGTTDQLSCLKKDGGFVPTKLSASLVDIKGKPCIILLKEDISEQKKQEKKAHLSETVFNVAAQAIIITDADRTILSVNPAFSRITGYARAEAIGKNPRLLSSGRHDRAFYDELWESVRLTGLWEGEIWNRKKNGEIYPEWLSIVSVKDKQEKVVYYTGLFSDITKRKLYEERLHFHAYYDLLTRLPNRMLIYERLSQAIIEARRNKKQVALLYVDLDGFKQVNDTFGHLFGDKILKNVAGRLLSCVRESDTVARAGGDEFLIVLHADRKEVTMVANKIIQRLSSPFQIDSNNTRLGASIGITIAPDDSEEVDRLLKNADMAMYKAKNSGRNTFHFFSETMESESRERIEMESQLNRALVNQELVIHYQPVIDLDSLKTISLEALVRWEHPQQGLLLPERFIPLAEESALISKIDTWVMTTACKQIKEWQERYGFNASLSVNISRRLFIYENLRTAILNALEESHLQPEFLTIEIREGLMFTQFKEIMARLSKIKEVGIKIAVDDFGASCSSLDSLSQYPVDFLKIDRSFILNVDSEPRKKPLVEAMVHMGQSMKIKVIAKGLERHTDLAYLTDLRCNAAQGYYFSKPISSEAYETILKERK